MEVGIDGFPLFVGGSELKEYCRQTIGSLCKQDGFQLHLLQDAALHPSQITQPFSQVCYHPYPINRHNLVKEQIRSWIQQQHIDLYHCMNNGFTLPREARDKSVCTIHTMLPYTHPSWCHPSYKEQFKYQMEELKDEPIPIVTPTFALKQELQQYIGIPEERLRVVDIEVAPIFSPLVFELGNRWVRDKWKLQGPYLLYIGDIHPRKQLLELIHFFAKLQSSQPDLQLLIGGSMGTYTAYKEKIKKLIYTLGIERSIYFTGEIGQWDRLYLYQEAVYFIDFGSDSSLSPYLLESIATGCPILCSKTQVHEELFGESAAYIEVERLQEILQQRDVSIALETTRTKAKPIQATTKRQLIDVYREILQGRK